MLALDNLDVIGSSFLSNLLSGLSNGQIQVPNTFTILTGCPRPLGDGL